MIKNIKRLLILSIITLIISGCQWFNPLVGKWELVSTNNVLFNFAIANEIEYFSDGTGRMYSDIFGGLSESFTWSAEGGRVKHENYGIIQIYDYQISGSNLTYYYNRANNSYSVYKRVR
ncbi:MAG: hypothetical protein FWD47_09295 [Treponema sp.]|nr:hypothetical protein [Treponema sp.]